MRTHPLTQFAFKQMDHKLLTTVLSLTLLATPVVSSAGEADVVDATISCDSRRVCSFSVSVKHADTGWDHYANHWRVLTPSGEELGKRVLHHPHENEQPFTRSLSGVKIPADVESVTLEAHDSVHEYGGKVFTLAVPGN